MACHISQHGESEMEREDGEGHPLSRVMLRGIAFIVFVPRASIHTTYITFHTYRFIAVQIQRK